VAACDPAQAIPRLMARVGLDEATARRRIAVQLPIAEKRARADFVIDTSGSIETTDRQVDEVARRLSDAAARRSRSRR
jgi:dephospho-CoA kinase